MRRSPISTYPSWEELERRRADRERVHAIMRNACARAQVAYAKSDTGRGFTPTKATKVPNGDGSHHWVDNKGKRL